MDTVLLVVAVIVILAYYGVMRSIETVAALANDEVRHMADVHSVSVINRTANLADKLSDVDLEKAMAVKVKIKAMKEGMKLPEE